MKKRVFSDSQAKLGIQSRYVARNVPSNGDFHRWLHDGWRVYPDSGNALINWAKRNYFNPNFSSIICSYFRL